MEAELRLRWLSSVLMHQGNILVYIFKVANIRQALPLRTKNISQMLLVIDGGAEDGADDARDNLANSHNKFSQVLFHAYQKKYEENRKLKARN